MVTVEKNNTTVFSRFRASFAVLFFTSSRELGIFLRIKSRQNIANEIWQLWKECVHFHQKKKIFAKKSKQIWQQILGDVNLFWNKHSYFKCRSWGSSKTFSNIKKMLNSLKWKLMRNNHVWRRIDETDVQWFLVTLCHILIKCEKKCILILSKMNWSEAIMQIRLVRNRSLSF